MVLDKLLKRQRSITERMIELCNRYMKEYNSIKPKLEKEDWVLDERDPITAFKRARGRWGPTRVILNILEEYFPDIQKEISELCKEWYVTSLKIIKTVLEEILKVKPEINAYLYSGDDVYWGRIIGGNWDYICWAWACDVDGAPKIEKNIAVKVYNRRIMEEGENYKIIWIKAVINPEGEIPDWMKNRYDFVVIDGRFPVREILKRGGIAISKSGKEIEGLNPVYELKEWYDIPEKFREIFGVSHLPIEREPYPLGKPRFYKKKD